MFQQLNTLIAFPGSKYSDEVLLKSNNKDLNKILKTLETGNIDEFLGLGYITTGTNHYSIKGFNNEFSIIIKSKGNLGHQFILTLDNETEIKIDKLVDNNYHIVISISKPTENPFIKEIHTFGFDIFGKLIFAFDVNNQCEITKDEIKDKCLLYIS